MKSQLKKLNRISKIDCLNLDNYYCITIHEGDIQLQGKFNGKISVQLTKLFGKGEICDRNGYVNFSKHNIEISLTE